MSDDRTTLFVKVICDAKAQRRNPQGVYQVDVLAEATKGQMAKAAILSTESSIPFVGENEYTIQYKVYDGDGQEIRTARAREPENDDSAQFIGRAADYPDDIDD